METGILTTLLNKFISVFNLGFAKLLPDAHHLLAILATLEIVLAGLWWAFDDGQRVEKALIAKVMQIGFFVWVVGNYRWLVEQVVNGFIDVGAKAGGNTNTSLLQDPSLIIDYGFAATDPIFQHLQNHYLGASLPDLVLSGLSGLLILLAYFALAAVVFITYLEFYIVSVLGLILVPFGVFKHTTFLSERVFGAVIAFGIRLMVLAFILAVVEPILAQIQLPTNPSFRQIFTVFLTAFTITGLSWHAPSVASGLMAGSPSLGVGTMMGTGLAAAAGIAGIGAASGLGAAVSSANKGFGQVAAASKAELSHAFGGSSGGGSGGGAGAGTTGSGVSVGTSMAGGASSRSQQTPSSASQKNSPYSPSAAPMWAQNIMMAHSVIPQDAHPGAGMTVPIRKD